MINLPVLFGERNTDDPPTEKGNMPPTTNEHKSDGMKCHLIKSQSGNPASQSFCNFLLKTRAVIKCRIISEAAAGPQAMKKCVTK